MGLPVRLRGPLSGLTGYGRSFCGIVKHLLRSRSLDIEVLALYNTPQTSADPEVLAVAGHRFDVKHWGLLYGIPTLLPSLGTDYRVVYTMYEATDVPRQWKIYLKQADEVWVPSQFCAEVFGTYNSNVKVVHIGVSEAFTPSSLPKSYFRQKLGLPPEWKHVYLIGTAGVMSVRKGIDVLLRAFSLAFGEKDEVRLLIKTRDTKFQFDGPLSRLANRVRVADEDWPEEKMVDFYRALDLFVLPTRGEGLGMPPLEAARCGIPVLVTAWSGPLEYIDNDGIWGIEVKSLVPSRSLLADAYYAEPDLDDLIDKLRWMYQNRRGVGRTYNYWTYQAAAKRFEQEILRSVRLRSL